MSEMPAMLRLGLPAGGLRQARKHPLLKGRARRGRQGVTILDTPDRRLAAAGWLCLSRDDGIHRRQEMLPVAGYPAEPPFNIGDDWTVLARGESHIATVPLGGDAAGIVAQFVTAKLQNARADSSWEEIVLHASVPERAPALTAVALAIAEEVPVRWFGAAPAVAAAAEIGLIEPPPARATLLPYNLAGHADAGEAFCAIARHCLAQFDANVLPVLRDRNEEAVHQMRVALRRLRSAAKVFNPLLPATALQPLLDDLRWLNGPLGRKRDLDVFLSETLTPLARSEAVPKGIKHLRVVMEERRDAAQAALESALTSTRCLKWRLGFARLLDDLPALVMAQAEPEDGTAPGSALHQPARQFAARVMRKRRRKVKKLGARHGELDAEQLHELRIRAKRLRYAVEFFRPLFGRKDTRRFLAALSALQDCLGALNDGAVGKTLIADILGSPADDATAAALTGWFTGRQQLQLAQLGACWKDFARLKPFWKDALAE